MNRNKLISIFNNHNPNTAMSEDETMFMMKVMLSNDPNFSCDINEMDTEFEFYTHFQPIIKSFIAQVFLKRIEALTSLKMTLGAFIILLAVSVRKTVPH